MSDIEMRNWRSSWNLPEAARVAPFDLIAAEMGSNDDRCCFGRSTLLWYDGPQVAIFAEHRGARLWLGVASDDAREPRAGMPLGFRTISRWVLAPISAYEAEALAALDLDAARSRRLWMRRPILVADIWETTEAAWVVLPQSVIGELPVLLDGPDAGQVPAKYTPRDAGETGGHGEG